MTEVQDEIVETTEEQVVEAVEQDVEETTEQTLERLELLIVSDDYEIEHKEKLEALKQHRQLSDKLPEAWSLEEVVAFLTMQIEPKKTTNGVYVEDVTRADKKAGAWSDEELVAWANGEVAATGRATEGALAQSLISRFKLRAKGNSPEAAIEAYLFMFGEMKPAEAMAETKVVEVKETVEVKPAESKPVVLEDKGLSQMNKNYIENTIQAYVERLKPGRTIRREEGVLAQKSLDNVIKYVINLEDPVGFKAGMDYLMDTIKRNREGGVFDDTYALRFTDGLPVGGNVQESHNRLLTLFFIFADDDKSLRKQTDVNYLVQFVPMDKQPLLLQYFSQYK